MKAKRKSSHKRRPVSRPAAIRSDFGLTFAAKDFPHHPKNHFWYIGIGLLAFAALAAFYRAGDYLLMLVVFALVLAVWRLAGLEPQSRRVNFNERGMQWGEEFLPYFQLRAFWVAETGNGANVYIERLNFSPTIHFILPENRVEELVMYLADHLPWHHHRNEPLGDKLSRLLRF